MLSVVMLIVIILSVIMLSVVAPLEYVQVLLVNIRLDWKVFRQTNTVAYLSGP
jgi:hypothetical protein